MNLKMGDGVWTEPDTYGRSRYGIVIQAGHYGSTAMMVVTHMSHEPMVYHSDYLTVGGPPYCTDEGDTSYGQVDRETQEWVDTVRTNLGLDPDNFDR